MMRITLDSPGLIAVRNWLAGSAARTMGRSGRNGRRTTARPSMRGEPLEPRCLLDAGMRALLPDLVDASDTGFSAVDNLTSDRTPALTGSVVGPATQVRLFIDGQPGASVPVTNGAWNYVVPAEAPLAAGRHTIAVRPVDASGKLGPVSKPLPISVVTASPTAPTVGLGLRSDTGVKGDGATTFGSPMLRGVAPRGQWVNVEIDGVLAGRVRSDVKTGAWMLQVPRLANGVHDVSTVAVNRAGLESAATSFEVTVDGQQTVMLDASERNTVELTASHLLGRGSQGFIVTGVHRGTLERWSAAQNRWVAIPGAAASEAAMLQAPAAIRRIAYDEAVRWTPSRGDVGVGPAFDVIPLDLPGGRTAPIPQAGTVPGSIRNPQIHVSGVGTTLTWEAPTDGCGCTSTRYSIQVTREDGQTRLYSVPSNVTTLSVVEGGRVLQAELWGATRSGAGTKRWHDAVVEQQIKNRLAYNLSSGLSALSVGEKARTQLAWSLTGTDGSKTGFMLGGSHSDLAYLEVNALPDATEAAQGLPARTPIIVSSESNKLTATQRAKLEENPILARNLFPGTVGGRVLPDQVRAHFQPGEMLRFSGNVDARVRDGATIVVEEAQILGDNSLGPWFEKTRVAVPADGGYAYDHVVAYGMTSVRVRLEHRTQPALTAARAPSVGATSSTSTAVVSTPIDLSGSFNAFGITTAPWQAPNSQGFDRHGNYYNSDYTGSGTSDPILGTPIVYNGITFPIGPIPTEDGQVGGSGTHPDRNPPNFVQGKGQTIKVSVDPDKSDYLYLAGAASNGNQLSQKITLTFTDGTTETWTQSFHDWASAGRTQSDSQTTPPQTKLPVRAATTAGLGTLSGLQTIDGVVLVAGDRVLVKDQGAIPTAGGDAVGSATDNGIYIASAGAWSRAKDADTGSELQDAATSVASGTANGGKYFVESSGDATITLGTTPISFEAETPPVSAPRPFAGELLLKTEPERINQLGNLVTTPAHIFAYCYNLKGKQLASITLPNNDNVGILSAVVAKAPVIAIDAGIASVVLGTTNLTGVDIMAMTIKNESNIGAGGGPLTFFFADQPEQGSVATPTQPATYTTKQVTVPMGQQTTIAYIAPDSTSQMTFYIQKEADTCVGANCSTYLTNWNNGSGNNDDWAANLSPSLNSQMQAGQHWTMTIQNAGEGYYGYLDSPSGQGLPSGNSNTPAGAQFKLETQAEINAQPPWAVALEEILGTIAVMVGLGILTGGIGDAELIGEEAGEKLATQTIADETTVDAKVSAKIASNGAILTENLLTDSFIAEVTGTGEGGVFFGDGIDAITNVDDLDSLLDGSWSELDDEFEGEVQADISLAEQQQIIEADAQAERINAAMDKVFREFGFF